MKELFDTLLEGPERVFYDWELEKFLTESNFIEPDIKRPPTQQEIEATRLFLALDELSIDALQTLTAVYQPNAHLRDWVGLNVRVGGYVPPKGGDHIVIALQEIIDRANEARITHNTAAAWQLHIDYENLHPFTDGNGRSGRTLWAWVYGDLSLTFLHRFYYQTLQNNSARKK